MEKLLFQDEIEVHRLRGQARNMEECAVLLVGLDFTGHDFGFRVSGSTREHCNSFTAVQGLLEIKDTHRPRVLQ